MAVTLTIAGVDRTTLLKPGTVEVDLQLGARSVLTCVVEDGSGVYRPAIGDPCVLADTISGTVLSGEVLDVEDDIVIEPIRGLQTRLSVVDKMELLERVFVKASYVSGTTLLAVLTDLVTRFFSAVGISLYVAQPTGPTFGELEFDYVRGSDVIEYLMGLIGWPAWVNSGGILFMWAPGSVTAPYSLDEGANNYALRSPPWTKQRQKYVNRVVVRYGAETTQEKTDTFAGDGSTRSFVLTYTVAAGTQPPTLDLGAGAVIKPVGIYGVDVMEWTFDRALNRMVHDAAYAVIGAGVPIAVLYSAQFPQALTVSDAAEIAANGLREEVVSAPEIFDRVGALELANGLIRRGKRVDKIGTYETRRGLVLPGQTQTINLPSRALGPTSVLILSVKITDDIDFVFRYAVTFVDGTERQQTWIEYWKEMKRGGGTASNAGTITGNVIESSGGHFHMPITASALDQQVTIGAINVPTYSGDFPGIQFGGLSGDSWWIWHEAAGSTRHLHWSHRPAAEVGVPKIMELRRQAGEYALLPDPVATALYGVSLGEASSGRRWTAVHTLALVTAGGSASAPGIGIGASNTGWFESGGSLFAALSGVQSMYIFAKTAGRGPYIGAESGAWGTGAVGGALVEAGRNASGNGAAGCFVYRVANGAAYYSFVDLEGIPCSSAVGQPTENGTTIAEHAARRFLIAAPSTDEFFCYMRRKSGAVTNNPYLLFDVNHAGTPYAWIQAGDDADVRTLKLNPLGGVVEIGRNLSIVALALGSGAIAGKAVVIGRNMSGAGAAGALVLMDRTGVPWFVWADTSGRLRVHSLPPTEDSSVADTAGTVVGTQT